MYSENQGNWDSICLFLSDHRRRGRSGTIFRNLRTPEGEDGEDNTVKFTSDGYCASNTSYNWFTIVTDTS